MMKTEEHTSSKFPTSRAYSSSTSCSSGLISPSLTLLPLLRSLDGDSSGASMPPTPEDDPVVDRWIVLTNML